MPTTSGPGADWWLSPTGPLPSWCSQCDGTRSNTRACHPLRKLGPRASEACLTGCPRLCPQCLVPRRDESELAYVQGQALKGLETGRERSSPQLGHRGPRRPPSQPSWESSGRPHNFWNKARSLNLRRCAWRHRRG